MSGSNRCLDLPCVCTVRLLDDSEYTCNVQVTGGSRGLDGGGGHEGQAGHGWACVWPGEGMSVRVTSCVCGPGIDKVPHTHTVTLCSTDKCMPGTQCTSLCHTCAMLSMYLFCCLCPQCSCLLCSHLLDSRFLFQNYSQNRFLLYGGSTAYSQGCASMTGAIPTSDCRGQQFCLFPGREGGTISLFASC